MPKTYEKKPGVARQNINEVIDQAIKRAIQVQRDQVLSALTSDDKERTKALLAIESLKVEIAESFRKLTTEIQDKQDKCKKDCYTTIEKSTPNYLAIIGLAMALASPFIAWVSKIQYDVWNLKYEFIINIKNNKDTKKTLRNPNKSSQIASSTLDDLQKEE